MKPLFTISPNDLKEAHSTNRNQRINAAAQQITAFVEKELVKVVGVMNEGMHNGGPVRIRLDNDLLHDHFCYEAVAVVVNAMKSLGYTVEYQRDPGFNMQDDETNVLVLDI